MAEVPLLQIVNTVAELKALTPSDNQNVLVIGKNSVTDNMGGFYRWDSSASDAEDTQFMNTLVSSVSSTGRWSRIFQKAKAYPEGIMVLNGGVKTLYCPTATDAAGKATVYPTVDGTPTGTALFSEVWQLSGNVNAAAATPGSVIVGSGNISTDYKTANFTFAKSNSTTIALLGTLVAGMQASQANVPVYITIVGV